MFQINIETKCLKIVCNNHLTNHWVKGGDKYDIFEKIWIKVGVGAKSFKMLS
jgi:hypothetical protein